jgi:EF-hand domain pair
MKSFITMLAALAVATTFTMGQDKPATTDTKPATGDGGKPGATTEKKPATAEAKPAAGSTAEKPKRDPEAMFKKRDTNSDGSINLDEFKTGAKDASKAEQAFKKRDKDGDGKITLEEFKAPVGKK